MENISCAPQTQLNIHYSPTDFASFHEEQLCLVEQYHSAILFCVLKERTACAFVNMVPTVSCHFFFFFSCEELFDLVLAGMCCVAV